MLEDAVLVAGGVALAVLVVKGATTLALAGFFTVAVGALFAGLFLNWAIAAAATLALTNFVAVDAATSSLPAVKAILIALSQPTLSGVAVTALLLVVGHGVAKATTLAADMDVLLAAQVEMDKEHAAKAKSA